MLKSVFQPLIHWYLGALKTGGYPLVVLLMTMESSILPLPSEVVIPPAAHLAYTNQIPLSLWGIVVAGALGSWLGATIMYWASRLAGRPLVMRYGRLVLITPEKIEGAERWTAHYGAMGIFISRMLPVVRHLIGIPAGHRADGLPEIFHLHRARLGHLVRGAVLRRRQSRAGRAVDAGANCVTSPSGSAARCWCSADFIISSSIGT